MRDAVLPHPPGPAVHKAMGKTCIPTPTATVDETVGVPTAAVDNAVAVHRITTMTFPSGEHLGTHPGRRKWR